MPKNGYPYDSELTALVSEFAVFSLRVSPNGRG
jgi:hypothetical protein